MDGKKKEDISKAGENVSAFEAWLAQNEDGRYVFSLDKPRKSRFGEFWICKNFLNIEAETLISIECKQEPIKVKVYINQLNNMTMKEIEEITIPVCFKTTPEGHITAITLPDKLPVAELAFVLNFISDLERAKHNSQNN